ncbi:MAG: Rrf2 family transcriptional regulator [Planctomycetota bacterium]
MLTRTSEYALQAMIYLVKHEDRWPLQTSQIAKDTGIPQKYLGFVLGDLVRAGVLDARRGRGGGFRMTKSPKATLLMDILAPFESTLSNRRPCPFGNTICSDDHPCGGHFRWKKVRESFHGFLLQTSVHDISFPEKAKAPRRSRATSR